MTQNEAREVIENQFRKTVDRNVSFLACDQLNEEGNTQAAELCKDSHAVISERLWSMFVFNWAKVFFNPGGTMGKANAFLQAKASLSYEWAVANGQFTDSVLGLEKKLLEDLNLLWVEWAGYSSTSSPELEVALIS